MHTARTGREGGRERGSLVHTARTGREGEGGRERERGGEPSAYC